MLSWALKPRRMVVTAQPLQTTAHTCSRWLPQAADRVLVLITTNSAFIMRSGASVLEPESSNTEFGFNA